MVKIYFQDLFCGFASFRFFLKYILKKTKAIIFDFDGVIAESVNVKTEAFAKLYRPFGKKIVEKVVAHHLANGGMSRYEKFRLYHREYLGAKLTDQQVNELSKKFSQMIVSKVISAPYVSGAYEFINTYHKDYAMFISTGTPYDEMVEILENRNLVNFFVGVYGSPEDKSLHIKEIIDRYGYEPDEMRCVGDSHTDLEASVNHGVPFVLRIHETNKHQFRDYDGKIIHDLTEFRA